ncbi:hypothetical protein [Brevibacillus laterosporus]|uniref:hypothetical protein n=1 Tax=Brevibacillus laterosporus TaxID=1465 RepID=UPI003D25326A
MPWAEHTQSIINERNELYFVYTGKVGKQYMLYKSFAFEDDLIKPIKEKSDANGELYTVECVHSESIEAVGLVSGQRIKLLHTEYEVAKPTGFVEKLF